MQVHGLTCSDPVDRGDKLWGQAKEEEFATFINPYMARDFICEPVWPSGKALGW